MYITFYISINPSVSMSVVWYGVANSPVNVGVQIAVLVWALPPPGYGPEEGTH